jgi:prepilin-type N-terminal cleavage/methylation domain-containing protein
MLGPARLADGFGSAGMNLPKANRRNSAFTIAEMAIVLAIISVLSAVAMLWYSLAIDRYRAAVAATRIAQDLALAQSVAKTTSAGQSVVFNTSSNSYQLPNYAAPMSGPAQSSYTISLSVDPYKATLASASFGGSATLTYDRFGQPSSGGTVVVQVGSSIQHTVTVDANTGKASVQ